MCSKSLNTDEREKHLMDKYIRGMRFDALTAVRTSDAGREGHVTEELTVC